MYVGMSIWVHACTLVHTGACMQGFMRTQVEEMGMDIQKHGGHSFLESKEDANTPYILMQMQGAVRLLMLTQNTRRVIAIDWMILSCGRVVWVESITY